MSILQEQRIDGSADCEDGKGLPLAMDLVCHDCQSVEDGLPIELVVFNWNRLAAHVQTWSGCV